jgi:hypothetical protein
MHLDEAQLQRLLHGELTQPSEIAAREHLVGCAVCRDRVAAAAQEETDVFALLGAVDHPVPAIGPGAIELRARAPDAGRLKWAAGIVLALGIAGIAYAAPGSPLPGWVSGLTTWMRPSPGRAPTAPDPSPAPAPAAGVAIIPGEHLFIVFTAPQAGARASVRLTDGAEVVVRAPSGAATFSSEADRLVIDSRAGAAVFDIQIPRSALHVEILVDGSRRFVKQRDRITPIELLAAQGTYAIPLSSRP